MADLLLTDGRRSYLIDSSRRSFHTKDGELDLTKAKPGKPLKTNKGKIFYVLNPSAHDLLLQSKRGPAVVLPKDFGAIIAHTGVNHESLCVDAGSGSGWLACQLANLCKRVVTYESRPEHADVAEANIAALGLSNIKLKRKDATRGFDEKNADLITLDLLNPEQVPFSKSLKLGGYGVAYLPHMAQVKQFCRALASGLIVERILDVREDEYFASGELNRKNKIRHTAYLVFVRKVA